MTNLGVVDFEFSLDIADPCLPVEERDGHVAEGESLVSGVSWPVLPGLRLLAGESHHGRHVVLHHHPPEVQGGLLRYRD